MVHARCGKTLPAAVLSLQWRLDFPNQVLTVRCTLHTDGTVHTFRRRHISQRLATACNERP
jgi:hypothetical protein